MRAFIVRPFGIKNGIDFDAMEKTLIQPALQQVGIVGATTGEIFAQGNIRTDMFQRLIAADLVIADVTANNANVFYELGIRHGLRSRGTFLLCGKGGDLPDVPFDLKTDRYLAYPVDNPASILAQLTEALRQTLQNTAKDSPVFQLLPALSENDPQELQVMPRDFQEAVQLAQAGCQRGDLGLLAQDIRDEVWEIGGLRRVGRALRGLRAYEGASASWKRLQQVAQSDREADIQLATLWQKLGDIDRSNAAIARALVHPRLTEGERAELTAQQASNFKTYWMAEFRGAPAASRRVAALSSPFLKQMLDAYRSALLWDPTHFYSAINAYAACKLRTALAGAEPAAWNDLFDTDEAAKAALDDDLADCEQLRAATQFALDSAEFRDKADRWFRFTLADLKLLSGKRRGVVRSAYVEALAEGDQFDVETLQRQLGIYADLDLFAEGVAAAREALAQRTPVIDRAVEPRKLIVFSGHRLDAPDRPTPRFPLDKVDAVKQRIRERVLAVAGDTPIDAIQAFAGGANGGDMLFLEVCKELGIQRTLLLAVPRDAYVPLSVFHPQQDWVSRFDALRGTCTERVLADQLAPPPWVSRPTNSAQWNEEETRRRGWSRANRWILQQGLAYGAAKMTLIALWDGQGGDGPGGTADLVALAKERGANTEIIGIA